MSWSDERVEVLKKLWGEGKTAAEIAKQLGEGVTRNAVIGKAHRLKLSSRISPIQQNTKKRKVADKPAVRAVKRPPSQPKMPEFKGKEVSLAELTDKMCRWPSGDPQGDDFSFCGCDVVEGLPYCSTHAQAAYQITSRAKTLNASDFADDAGTPDDLELKNVSTG
ncbi:MAG: GcrA family cell cycle regulator [Pseudomonadota bacterium]